MVSPFFALIVMGLAWATGWLLLSLRVIRLDLQRRSPLDGLRGYLALGVFCHHAVIWYFYLRHGRWEVPPSGFYTLLGQGAVALFFMISAFLFCTKVIESDTAQPAFWLRLYVSRVLRLGPLYWAAMLVLFAVVAVQSGFEQRSTLLGLARQIIVWLGFAIAGQPGINGFGETSAVMAGVVWSLPYEWLFYLTLPFFALVMRRRVAPAAIVLAVVGLGIFRLVGAITAWQLEPFVGGIAAAMLVRSAGWRHFATSPAGGRLAILCLGLGFGGFNTAYSAPALAVLSIAFALIAGGQSLYGVLLNDASRLLGEISYGLYLLQGFVLYGLFTAVMQRGDASALTVGAHWGLVASAAPVLVLLCAGAHVCIEAPGMRLVQPCTKMISDWLEHLRLPSRARTDSIGS